jgi:hypothetical protein
MSGFSGRLSNEIKTVDVVLSFYAVGACNKGPNELIGEL